MIDIQTATKISRRKALKIGIGTIAGATMATNAMPFNVIKKR